MGIHHITAIAGDPQRNLDFYAGTLGLRLIKVTVNFDDPGTYHLNYGDQVGPPGSILTFFPWPGGRPGRQGTGQAGAVSFAIAPVSLGLWIERLLASGVKYEGPTRRFEEQVIGFKDPDGLLLELIATPRVADVAPWSEGPVPAEHAIRGFHGTTLWEDGDTGSAAFLTRTMGFEPVGKRETSCAFSRPLSEPARSWTSGEHPGSGVGPEGSGRSIMSLFARQPTPIRWPNAPRSRPRE